MIEPRVLEPRISTLLAVVGGTAGMVLLSGLLFLMPALGLAHVDLPRLIGGLFVGDEAAAFWLGYALFFVGGTVLYSIPLALLWARLPGRRAYATGTAVMRGLLWGLGLWALTGLLLPLLASLNRVEGLASPGFFALDRGLGTALVLLAAFLGYGVVTALIGAMGRGIAPLNTLGWVGYSYGITRESARRADVRQARGSLSAPFVDAPDAGRPQ